MRYFFHQKFFILLPVAVLVLFSYVAFVQTSTTKLTATIKVDPVTKMGKICIPDCVGNTAATCPEACSDGGAACDDGNTKSYDGCSDQNKTEPGWICLKTKGLSTNGDAISVCEKLGIRTGQLEEGNATVGNGVVHQSTEKCDDGNSVSGDGCSNKGNIESGWLCVNQGPANDCDNSKRADSDGNCETTGTISYKDPSQCVRIALPTCGNGNLDQQSGEQCDVVNSSLTYSVNAPSCSSGFKKCTGCLVECSLCGNGSLDSGEECEGTSFATDALTCSANQTRTCSDTCQVSCNNPVVPSTGGGGSGNNTPAITFGGTVSGLSGSVTLQLLDSYNLVTIDTETVTANGTYTFSAAPSSGVIYVASVSLHPVGQSCIISNNSGTMGSSSVTNVNLDCATAKGMFVTSSSWDGNFTVPGPTASFTTHVDSNCTAQATALGYTGTYKALIVGGTSRVACTTANCNTGGNDEHTDWVLSASTRYVRSDRSDLIGTTTDAGIFSFYLSGSVTNTSNTAIWTGLDANWTKATNTCSDWNSSINGIAGRVGEASSVAETAISSNNVNCNTMKKLLCVQQ